MKTRSSNGRFVKDDSPPPPLHEMPTREELQKVYQKILSLVLAINLMEEGPERKYLVEALLAFVWRAWQWDVRRFQEEIENVRKQVENSRVEWVFTKEQIEFSLKPK